MAAKRSLIGRPSRSYRLARHDDVPTSSANTAPSAAIRWQLYLMGTVVRMPEAAPYGGWRSPITAASIAAGGVSLGFPDCVDGDADWLQGQPLGASRVGLGRQAA